nr:MAG TPA: hypothetical protein [Caudoviricetes sp.]
MGINRVTQHRQAKCCHHQNNPKRTKREAIQHPR